MTDASLYRQLTEPTRSGDRSFITHRDGSTLSYPDFHLRCDRMADVLRDRGVGPGDRIVVQVTKSVDALVVYIASLRIGAIYVPLNPSYTADEVAHHISDAAPVLYIGDHRVASPAAALDDLVADAATADGSTADTSASAGQTATMLYTSGTTGRPKGAPATAAGLLRNGWDLAECWQFTGEDTLLHVLPLFHVHGLFVAMHCSMLTAGRVILHERFDAETAIDALPDATAMMGVPTMYTRMLRLDRLDREATATMRLFTSGSARLPAPAHEEFTARTGHTIVERYGLTETGILTSNRIGEERAGTVGHPLPGIELRVADAGGSVRSVAEPGEVQVRGVTVTAGYWKAPDATRAALTADGWFRTGDVATTDETGRITLLGRDKDVVISGGLNIYPAELETAILSLGTIQEVAVIGVPHPDLGEAVVAVSTTDVAEDPPVLDAVASFKRPKAWIAVDELPRNAMGKIQKHVLRNRFAGHFES